MTGHRPRMILVGLDCAAPSMVFERYAELLPNLGALRENGTWGRLRSSEPPITVPAWTCMVSGRDAGEIGLYGFRNRVPGGTALRICDGRDIGVKRIWDWIGEHGHRVAPLFVPPTSPPSPVNGHMVSGFMWPGGDARWCYPGDLERELGARFGAYRADVESFRGGDLDRIYEDIVAMTNQHFDIAEYVWTEKRPSFMMTVEIGLDRFHHAFWRHIDPSHPRHESGNPWKHLGGEYHRLLDTRIGRLRRLAGEEANFVVASDHGARAMRGGFRVNEWLRRQGYLTLREEPRAPTRLDHAMIDWANTSAWAEGGYYARVFLNVRGREPRGSLNPNDARAFRERLQRELEAAQDDLGESVAVRVRAPEEYYQRARGFPPDLMVYFGDLALRAIGSVGGDRIVVEENDTGPDGCNHDWDGILVMEGPGIPARGRIEGAEIYDLTPTILGAYGIERPPGILGRDWTV